MYQEHQDSTRGGGSSGKVIILVSDEAGNSSYLAQIISQKTPHHLYHATNSLAVLKFIRYIQPHLFILDCYHLQENGIPLYKQLQANRELANIPVILLGTYSEHKQDDKKKSNLIILENLIDLNTLLSTITKLLG